jgi:hypothetical protein
LRVAGFGDALWLPKVMGLIAAGRLSLSSVVDMAQFLSSGQFDPVAVFSSRYAFRLSAMD